MVLNIFINLVQYSMKLFSCWLFKVVTFSLNSLVLPFYQISYLKNPIVKSYNFQKFRISSCYFRNIPLWKSAWHKSITNEWIIWNKNDLWYSHREQKLMWTYFDFPKENEWNEFSMLSEVAFYRFYFMNFDCQTRKLPINDVHRIFKAPIDCNRTN